MNWYNGFSPKERSASARLARKLRELHQPPPPDECSVCGRSAPVPLGWHGEDYRDPLGEYAVCWRCHHAIHIRFKRPQYWCAYIEKVPPDCWVNLLSVDPDTLTRPFDETYPAGLPK